ncbi:hypothetical protein V1525DRAFT_56517 [Lipomyces kononenkoae]|uniref:Uncharacterized protein n=1 Tax=Lipomyces kononenkoae TaxID=34357 RepID=A0ACC3T6F8_LIPKO
MRSYYADYTVKEMYISGAPQCPIPDAFLNDAMTNSYFDFYFVQFYNNYCGIDQWSPTESTNFNFDSWDSFAKTASYNSDVKVYLGIPASSTAAGTGYVAIDTLTEAAAALMSTYSSFGGIMMWDASQAYNNIPENGLNYAQLAKTGLVSAAVAEGTASSSAEISTSVTSWTTIAGDPSSTTLEATATDTASANGEPIEESTLSLATTSAAVGVTVVTISSVTLSSPIQTLVADQTSASSIMSSTSSLGPTATYPVVSISPPPSEPTQSPTVDSGGLFTELISYTSTVYNTAFSTPVKIIFFSTITSTLSDIEATSSIAGITSTVWSSLQETASSPVVLSSTAETTSDGAAISETSQSIVSVNIVQPTASLSSTEEATSLGYSTVYSTISEATSLTSTFTVGPASTSTTSEAVPTTSPDIQGTSTNTAVAATSTISTSITFITNPPWSATATTSSSTESATSASAVSSCPINGAPCAVHGELACNGYYWGQCVWGTWVVRQCYTGLMCKTGGSYVYCDYPGADTVSSCAVTTTSGLTKRSPPVGGTRLRRHAHMHARRNHFHSPFYDPELGKKYFPHVPVKRQVEPDTVGASLLSTYTNLTLATQSSATAAIATGQVYVTSTAANSAMSASPVIQQVQFSASGGCGGSMTGTYLPATATATASAIASGPTSGLDEVSANGAVEYMVGFSIQQLNTTNFVGTLSASPRTNAPIGKSWMFAFTSPYVIDQVSRGELTTHGDGSYQVHSIEIEEASSYMAVRLTFWGTYTSSGAPA